MKLDTTVFERERYREGEKRDQKSMHCFRQQDYCKCIVHQLTDVDCSLTISEDVLSGEGHSALIDTLNGPLAFKKSSRAPVVR